jgi:hypothetical protein
LPSRVAQLAPRSTLADPQLHHELRALIVDGSDARWNAVRSGSVMNFDVFGPDADRE